MFVKKLSAVSTRRVLMGTVAGVVGLGASGAYAANPTPIDTNQPFYLQSNVGTSVNPDFEGGVLRADQAAATDAHAYTVGNVSTNTIDTFGHSITFSGVFSGAGPITVTDSVGGGWATFSAANTYTGATTINASGTLKLSGAGAIAASSGVAANGTFDISGTTSGASITTLSGSGNVNIGAETLTLTNASSTFSGAINGTTGGFTVAGGTETLTGASTYGGATTVNNGATLNLAGTGSIASSSDVVVNGAFDISGTSAGALVSGVSGSGTVNLGVRNLLLTFANDTFSGAITGTGGITLTNGTETLTGVNTYTGFTNILLNSTLAVSGGGSIAGSQVNVAGTFDISGATGPSVSVTGLSSLGAHPGAVSLGANTLVLTAANNTVFSGVIDDGGLGGGLTVNGGTETLTGTNTYTGATTIGAGATLNLGNGGATGTVASTSIVDNGTLNFNYSGSNTEAAVISGAGGVGVNGGTVTLTAADTYTGATNIASGATLALSGAGSIAGSSGVADNGTFDLTGATSPVNVTSLSGAGSVLLGSKTLQLTNASGTFSGVISDGGLNGSLVISGGAETLSGVNTYTGLTSITSGSTLKLSGSGSIATSSDLLDNGTFDISGTTAGASIASLGGGGNVVLGAQNLTITAGNPADLFSGVISGTGGVSITGGTETFAGANTYSGNTNISSGASLLLTTSGTSGSISNSRVIDNGTFDISGLSAGTSIVGLSGSGGVTLGANTLTVTAASDTYAGVMSGTGGLTVAGGVQQLTGNNTYTGVTTINSGAQLDLGDGTSANGTIASTSIVDNGIVYFAYSAPSNVTEAAVISGTGAVSVGSGTVTLTGTNTYSGGTFIFSTLALTGTGSIANSTVYDYGTFDISGATINESIVGLADNGAGTSKVHLGANTLTLTSPNGTYSGVIDGAGGLTIAGGVEALSGANTYTGATTIASGAALSLTGSGSIAGSSVVDNGVFNIINANGNESIVSLSGASTGVVNLGANTLILSNAAGTFSGVIGGTGGLHVTGGSETLGGANTYTGTTTIDSGATLALTGTGSISSSSVVDNGTFDISGATINESIVSLSDGGAGTSLVHLGANSLTLTNASGSFSGVIDGTGGLNVTGGTATLTGANTYTGNTVITANGTLDLTGTGSVADSATVHADGVFDISGTTAGASIIDLSGAGSVKLGAETLTITGGASTFGGVISGSGGVTVTGGTETLSGVNTYTGATSISSGATLALSGAGSIATSSGVVDNGTFDISAATGPTVSIVTLSDSGGGTSAVNLGANTLVLTNAAGTFSGVIGGTGGLTLSAGTETLTNDNTFTGATTIASGATLNLGDGSSAAGSVGGNITDNGALVFNHGVATAGYGGVISGTGTVLVTGTSQTQFTGVNTYTGATTIDAGATLGLVGAGSIADSSNVAVNGTFDVSAATGPTVSIVSLSGANTGSVLLGSNTLTLTDASGTFAGVIGGGAGGLTIAGGTETLLGANTFTGATTIATGATLNLGDGVTDGTLASTSIVDNGLLNFDYLGVHTEAAVISGTGNVELSGGSVTLTGANTYTGWTEIGSGLTLALSGSGSIANSSNVYDYGILDISQTTGTSIVSVSDNAGGDLFGAIHLGSQTLTLTNASGTFSGIIADGGIAGGTGGGLTISGGTETLAGVNTYTGLTDVMAGATLKLAGSGSIATSNQVLADGTFDISGASGGVSITDLGGASTGKVVLGANTLTLTDTDDTFNGVISGTGGLTVAFLDETLTGVNTYSGATTINAGAFLYLSGGGSIANSSVVDDGTFDISGATGPTVSVVSLSDTGGGTGSVVLGANTLSLSNASGTFSGVISGAGGLTVAGGTETLTGTNTYTGTTTIASGATLGLGSGGATGSIASTTIVDNGTLLFTYSAPTSVTKGVGISGTGGVTVAGGTVTMTGTNTYTGATTIGAGATLALTGTGSVATSSGVADNGTFDISGATAPGASITSLSGSSAGVVTLGANTLTITNASGAFAGAINGTGGLTLAGGTEVLNGVNTFSGTTTVNGGTLEVGDAAHSGASLAGSVIVGAAGTLSGHGTVGGAVTNTAGGTVSPGGTIGTLTVGSYVQGSTSILAIEVSPTAASQLHSLSTATLAGKLALTFDPGLYTAHIYPIVVADTGVTGTFSSVTATGSPGLVYGLTYKAGETDLVTESTSGGQVFGAVSTASLNRAHGFASLVEDRFGDAGCADGSTGKGADACHGMGAWIQAVGGTDKLSTTSGAYGFSSSGAGVIGGIDRRLQANITLGVAFGYEDDSLSMDGSPTSASGKSYFGALYGRWSVGRVDVDAQAFYMKTDWSVRRVVSGFGTGASSPNGTTGGGLIQISAPLGADGDFRPYGRLAYAEFDRDSVVESLPGASVNFAVAKGSTTSIRGEVGVQYAHTFEEGPGSYVRPAISLGVSDDFGDKGRAVTGSLAAISGTSFTVQSVKPEQTAAVLDASVKWQVRPNFELNVSGRGRFSGNETDAVGGVGGAIKF